MSQPVIDFNGLDTAVHGPVRLGLLTALVMDGPLDFTTLKERLSVGDGVLGMHARKLEDAGYIRAEKAFAGRRPKTTYHLTDDGRKAFMAYMDAMRKLLEAVASDRPTTTPGRRGQ
jgi:DNA-binding MarR family transcriptional regulator